MTPLEAINVLEKYQNIPKSEVVKEAYAMAISALEKQIPKKPNKINTKANVCPCCNRFIDRHEQKHGNLNIPYCKWCGQAIDWSDTE